MRPILALLLVFISLAAHAQTKPDSTPAQKHPTLPAMEVLGLDSTTITNTFSFEEGRPTLIFLFSPDCDHCGIDADTLIRFMREKPNLRVVAVSFAPIAQIRAFAKEHRFEGTPNLTYGKDPYTFVPRFFGVQYFPYFALYNKEKKLVQTWDGGVKWDTLRSLLK